MWVGIILISLAAGFLSCFVVHFDRLQGSKGLRDKAAALMNYKVKCLLIMVSSLLLASLSYGVSMEYYKDTFHSLNLVMVVLLMVPLAFIDLEKHLIPNKLLLAGLVLKLLIYAYVLAFKEHLLQLLIFDVMGMLIGGGVFLLGLLIKKGSAGMGDVKLFGFLGLFLGVKSIFNVLLVSVIFCFIVGIVLILLKIKDRKSQIPMAPFALAGIVACIFFGL